MDEAELLTLERSERTRAKRRSRRFWLTAVILLGLGGAAWFSYLYYAAGRRLRIAHATADRLDPGWRLHEIEAKRAEIPDAENGAIQVLAVATVRPASWPIWDSYTPADGETVRIRGQALSTSFENLEGAALLNEDQAEALRSELKRAEAMLVEARKLADLPRGRHAVAWSRNYLKIALPHAQIVREVANFLTLDAVMRAHDGDLDGAITSCRAALNAGRSLGDEETLISQLVRLASVSMAVQRTQRILSQGQASPAELARLQRAFLEEAHEPHLLYGLRGERAGTESTLEMIQTGELPYSEMRAMVAGAGLLTTIAGGTPEFDELRLWLFSGSIRSNRAALLEYLNAAVEIAKLPPQEQRAAFDDLANDQSKLPLLARAFSSAYRKIAEAGLRVSGDLRCAAAALAAERYRIAHGRWPESLEVLVPDYLVEVPKDPGDGKPLRYRRCEDGVLIYHLGIDTEDNGGKLTRLMQLHTDRGVRLYDADKRRQPALPLRFDVPDSFWWEHAW